MASLAFENLPTYSWPGGPVSGAAVLTADTPTRGQNLSITLTGRELAQVTVSRGKESERLTEESVFFQQTWDPGPVLSFADPVHVAPGVYRAPFQFTLPTTAEPSLHSSPSEAGGGGFLFRRDGVSVEYTLEARLRVPLWTDLVASATIPVFSSRRVLGALPPVSSPTRPDHASISLGGSSSTLVLPGGTIQIPFAVENPGGKRLRALRGAFTRVVEYRARGVSGTARSPTCEGEHPLGGNEPHYAGVVEIAVPNTEDATGPGQGRLYATYWTAKFVLDVELGLNVEVEGTLLPA